MLPCTRNTHMHLNHLYFTFLWRNCELCYFAFVIRGWNRWQRLGLKGCAGWIRSPAPLRAEHGNSSTGWSNSTALPAHQRTLERAKLDFLEGGWALGNFFPPKVLLEPSWFRALILVLGWVTSDPSTKAARFWCKGEKDPNVSSKDPFSEGEKLEELLKKDPRGAATPGTSEHVSVQHHPCRDGRGFSQLSFLKGQSCGDKDTHHSFPITCNLRHNHFIPEILQPGWTLELGLRVAPQNREIFYQLWVSLIWILLKFQQSPPETFPLGGASQGLRFIAWGWEKFPCPSNRAPFPRTHPQWLRVLN